MLRIKILLVALLVASLAACSLEKTPEEYYELAVGYRENKQIAESMLELKNALQLKPEYGEARLLLGELHLLLGEVEEAQAQLYRLQQEGFESPELQTMLLKSLLQQRKFIEVLINSPKIDDPDASADLLTLRARAYVGQRKPERARAILAKALELEPENTTALVTSAGLRLITLELDEGKEYLDRLEKLDSSNLELWLLRAEFSLVEKNPEQAIKHFSKASEFQGADLRASVGLARLYLGQQNLEAATEAIARISKQIPGSVLASYFKGAQLLLEGKREAAKTAFNKALSIDPEHLESLLFSAQLAYEDGQYEQAFQYIKSFRKTRKHFIPAVKLSAAIDLRLNYTEKAVNTLIPYVEDNSDDPQFLSLLGSAYMADGDSSKGTMYLAKAAEKSPENTALQTRLAFGQIQSGEINLAIKGLESVIELDPDLLSVNIFLIYLQIQEGDIIKAREMIEKSIATYPDDPVYQNLLGGIGLKENKLDEAKSYFKAAIELDKTYIPAYINLTRIALRQDNKEAAKDYLNKILKQNDSNEQALVLLANLSIDEKNYDEALLYLEQATLGNVNAIASRIMLATYYLAKNDLARAHKIESELLEAAAEHPDVIDISARIAATEGKYKEAIALYNKVIQIQDDYFNAYLALGSIYVRTGEYSLAESTLDQALEIDPDNLAAMIELSRIYMLNGQTEKVVDISQKIQNSYPDNPEAMVIRADLALSQGEFQTSLNLYREAFKTTETSVLAIKVSELMRKTGDNKGSVNFLKKWLNRFPADANARSVLATWLYQDNDSDAAIRLYTETLKTAPNNIAALNNLAYFLNERGDSRALEYSQRAYEIAPENFNIIDTHAWVLISNGQRQQGLLLLEPVIRNYDDVDPTMIYHYAFALFLTNQKEEAKKQFQKLVEARVVAEIPGAKELGENLR